MKKFVILLILLFSIGMVGCGDKNEEVNSDISPEVEKKKPVIYLYPEEILEVDVTLDYEGELTCTYPVYNNGWKVIAYPDGTLINLSDGMEYSYLFWEGRLDHKWVIKEGFVVEGEKTVEFLQDKLSFLGLKANEYNDFISFWLPHMQENKYNLIYFAGDEYKEMAKLKINPSPDSILRVFMVYQGLDEWVDVSEQELKQFNRSGFTVIEWGGAELKNYSFQR